MAKNHEWKQEKGHNATSESMVVSGSVEGDDTKSAACRQNQQPTEEDEDQGFSPNEVIKTWIGDCKDDIIHKEGLEPSSNSCMKGNEVQTDSDYDDSMFQMFKNRASWSGQCMLAAYQKVVPPGCFHGEEYTDVGFQELRKVEMMDVWPIENQITSSVMSGSANGNNIAGTSYQNESSSDSGNNLVSSIRTSSINKESQHASEECQSNADIVDKDGDQHGKSADPPSKINYVVDEGKDGTDVVDEGKDGTDAVDEGKDGTDVDPNKNADSIMHECKEKKPTSGCTAVVPRLCADNVGGEHLGSTTTDSGEGLEDDMCQTIPKISAAEALVVSELGCPSENSKPLPVAKILPMANLDIDQQQRLHGSHMTQNTDSLILQQLTSDEVDVHIFLRNGGTLRLTAKMDDRIGLFALKCRYFVFLVGNESPYQTFTLTLITDSGQYFLGQHTKIRDLVNVSGGALRLQALFCDIWDVVPTGLNYPAMVHRWFVKLDRDLLLTFSHGFERVPD